MTPLVVSCDESVPTAATYLLRSVMREMKTRRHRLCPLDTGQRQWNEANIRQHHLGCFPLLHTPPVTALASYQVNASGDSTDLG